MIGRKTSWTASPLRTFKRAPVRLRAAKYADARYDRKSCEFEWRIAFDAFLSGWLGANRVRYPQLRVRIKA